jgi:hypothetical protein
VRARGLSARKLQRVSHQVAHDLPRRAQLSKFREDQAGAIANALIGIELGHTVLVTEKAGRERLRQFATPGFRESSLVKSQADAMKFCF